MPAEQRCYFFVFREAELHEVVTELAPVGLLVLEGFLKLCRGNALLLEEQLANSKNCHAYQIRSNRVSTRKTDNNYYKYDIFCLCRDTSLY